MYGESSVCRPDSECCSINREVLRGGVYQEVPESGLHVACHLSLGCIVPYPARIGREGRAPAGTSNVFMGMDSRCVFQN
jgi:hypothetical protein